MKENILSLTSVRAIACLTVFFGHAGNYGGYNLYGAERIGVMLFFCLSGFLITYLYADYRSLTDWKHYGIRRFMRIYPLYAATVLLLTLYLAYFKSQSGLPTSLKQASAVELLMLIDEPWVFWTVRTEIAFYLFFPLFITICHTLKVTQSPWGMLVLLTTLLIAAHQIPHSNFANTKGSERFFLTLFRSEECFITGMIVGWAYRMFGRELRAHASFFAAASWILFAAYIASLPVFAQSVYDTPLSAYKYKNLYYYALPLSILMSLMILSFAIADQKIRLIFHSRPLLFIGNISFGIYLVHDVFLRGFIAMEWVNTSHLMRMGFAIFFTLLTAYILHIFVERPGIAFGRKITTRH